MFSESKNIQNKNDIYLLYDKTNKLISKDIYKKNFKILRDDFKTEKQRLDYFKSVKKVYEPTTPFQLVFTFYKDPLIVSDISNYNISSIESISKEQIKILHRTHVNFIIKENCNTYKVYETRMRFEE